ncbi:MAG: GNAT family N-acetyltransferase [Lachnospiraceae bacterium]|nr:GNAT family N-acetyltransferase [Lachnospiraceae bacterium]
MISKLKNITPKQLNNISKSIGEAFVTNEMFHNWGTIEERRDDVITYMSIYVDYVYHAGELYSNEDMTGFIGLEDTARKPILLRLKMLFGMIIRLPFSRIRSLISFVKQIDKADNLFVNKRHIDTLMVCVKKDHQGQGIATELVEFAKRKAKINKIPLLFHTDMPSYAEMYKHLGCRLYNEVTADNGVTRYCLCYNVDKRS